MTGSRRGEIYIIENQIYNFLVFWARCDGAQWVLRRTFWSSLITLMLSSAVSPHLYCFSCNLGIFISSLMVFGCFMILVIVVLLPVFKHKTTRRIPSASKTHARPEGPRRHGGGQTQDAGAVGTSYLVHT